MKRIAIFALLLVLILSGCGGKVDDAKLTIGTSYLYSEKEIQSAMRVVMNQFERGFESCKLLTLTYDEESSVREADDWAEQYEADEAIVLESSFYVIGSKNPTLNPNSTYRGWQWILTRNGNGRWELQTCGY
jgi:hypothetical protein